MVVRGGIAGGKFHEEVFMHFLPSVVKTGAKPSRPSGGGRIVHAHGAVLVFGQSYVSVSCGCAVRMRRAHAH